MNTNRYQSIRSAHLCCSCSKHRPGLYGRPGALSPSVIIASTTTNDGQPSDMVEISLWVVYDDTPSVRHGIYVADQTRFIVATTAVSVARQMRPSGNVDFPPVAQLVAATAACLRYNAAILTLVIIAKRQFTHYVDGINTTDWLLWVVPVM